MISSKEHFRNLICVEPTIEMQNAFKKNLKDFLKSNASKSTNDESVIGYKAFKNEPELENISNFIPQNAKEIEDSYLEYSVYLIPCISVDKQFNRLGRGGGFYDRLIEKVRTQNKNATIFVCCFSKQIVDYLPTKKHDQKVDGIITENKIIIS
ncbi:MAG: hypothetical protein LBB10_02065 [Bifidobacteriaceae bacterium]|jgi:5-formyltetrahydrofolate cyclo-ligase|nr:hypothetical protein [Bifidobacteriaceae bacterium]